MKSTRIVLLGLVLAASAVLGGLLLLRDTSPAANCSPGDVECVREALDELQGASLAERAKVVADADRLAANPGEICGALGRRIGFESFDPRADLDAILREDSAVGCRQAVISGVLASWSAMSPTEEDLSLVLGRCAESADPLCAEAVAYTAAATLQPGPAAETCYRLDSSMRRNCVSNFLFGIQDKQALLGEDEDPREAVVVFCVYWPVERPVEDCYAAAGTVFYAPVIESALTGALSGLNESAGFCDRFGEGSLACQAAGYPLAVYVDLAGDPGSDARREYCGFLDDRLAADCLALKGDQPPVTD